MPLSSLNHLQEVTLFFLLLKTVLYNWGSSHDADLIWGLSDSSDAS